MAPRSHHSLQRDNLDRDYRLVGWWGLALAAVGTSALILVVASLFLN